jgi:DedD protein
MQKDQVDQEISFKKRARRRLVGAIALVLLMVIILPMLLEDREENMQEEDVEIIMPNEQPSNSDAEASASFDESVVEVVGDEGQSNEESVVSEVVEVPKVKTEAKKSEPKEAVKVEKKVTVKQPDRKEAVAKKPVASKDSDVSDKFYVQIGVFSDPSNIKKLQSKLDDLGYKSLTEKITTDTGVKTRLRTESFIGRNEAVIALENIKDAGLAGMVVNQK